jgi:hypothetical protein
MSDVALIEYAHRSAPVPLRESASTVWRTTGKSLPAQLREIWRLHHAFGQLTPREYYYFGLYDDTLFSPEEKARFIGVDVQNQILWRCTDTRWWATAVDKIAFCAFMQSYGFPVIKVQATLHPYRHLAGVRALRTVAETAHFLRHEAVYPLFSKPFDGMRSVGSARIDAYDSATDELVLYPQRRVLVNQFIGSIERYLDGGYLFQDVQHPHERVRAVCGDRLATVRMVVIVGPHGPEPFRAVWKIPAGPNVADNFWRAGNLLGGIDLATGRVTRVITGVGTQRLYVGAHPDTGAPLRDMVIPDWEALTALCLNAASTMPGITLQGWDIAPCESGPVLVEVNVGGDFTLPQLGNATGMLDDRFRAYLDARHFRPRSLPPWGFHLRPRSRFRTAIDYLRRGRKSPRVV